MRSIATVSAMTAAALLAVSAQDARADWSVHEFDGRGTQLAKAVSVDRHWSVAFRCADPDQRGTENILLFTRHKSEPHLFGEAWGQVSVSVDGTHLFKGALEPQNWSPFGIFTIPMTDADAQALMDGRALRFRSGKEYDVTVDLSAAAQTIPVGACRDSAVSNYREPAPKVAQTRPVPALPPKLPEDRRDDVEGVFQGRLTADNQFFLGGLTYKLLEQCAPAIPRSMRTRLGFWAGGLQAKTLAGPDLAFQFTGGMAAQALIGCPENFTTEFLLAMNDILDERVERHSEEDGGRWSRGCLQAGDYTRTGCACVNQVMSSRDPDISTKAYSYADVKRMMNTPAGALLLMCALL